MVARHVVLAKPPTMASSDTTTDHSTIKRWAKEHDGIPTRIKDTGKGKGGGVLRIHFPEASEDDENFEKIEWEAFFRTFDDSKLAFLHSTDKDSTFHKFVNR